MMFNIPNTVGAKHKLKKEQMSKDFCRLMPRSSSVLQKKTKASFSFSPLPKPLSHDAYRTSKGIESFLLFSEDED